jgi:hypothetical protein
LPAARRSSGEFPAAAAIDEKDMEIRNSERNRNIDRSRPPLMAASFAEDFFSEGKSDASEDETLTE